MLSLLLIPVAPYVGAWIETFGRMRLVNKLRVAPYVGAWIETNRTYLHKNLTTVAPYVGAWIETIVFHEMAHKNHSRTLRVCVD